VAKRERFGKISAISASEAPNHFASVAAYWSTEVVGSRRPSLETSSGPARASDGKRP